MLFGSRDTFSRLYMLTISRHVWAWEHVLCILTWCSSSQIKRTPHPFHSLDIPFCFACLHNISHALGRSCDLCFFATPDGNEVTMVLTKMKVTLLSTTGGTRWISSKHDPSEVGHWSRYFGESTYRKGFLLWGHCNKSRWWISNTFLCSPLFRKMIQFDEHIFQMGGSTTT